MKRVYILMYSDNIKNAKDGQGWIAGVYTTEDAMNAEWDKREAALPDLFYWHEVCYISKEENS